MPKVDVNKVAEILQRNKVDPKLLRQIIEEINQITQAEAAEEKPPPQKKQFVMLVSDPEDLLPKDEFAGWVLQMPENESPATVMERVLRAAYEYNATRKGRLYPVKSIGEALENVPAKHFKEADLFVKTKVPVQMLRTDNQIPRDPGNKHDR